MSKEKSKEKKQSTLELLAGGLSEEAVRKKVLDPSRKAFMSYDFTATKASSYDQFNKIGSGFVKHYMKETGMGDISDEKASALFQRYINKAFESEGGIKAAYESARKDMFGVIQNVSRHMESEAKNDYTQDVFSVVDPTDFEAQKEIATETIGALGSLYKGPTKKPEALAHNWRMLAMNYAGMRDTAKNLVGDYDTKKAA